MVEDLSDRRAIRHAERRRRILEVAADEFSAVGYQRATLERIGARIGLSKAALYYYVDGKEDLFARLLETAIAAVAERATRLSVPRASVIERLRAFVTAHVEIAVTTPAGRLLAETVDLVAATGHARDVWEEHRATLVEILEDGIAVGELRSMPTHVVAALLFGSLNSVPRWFRHDGELPLDQVIEQAVDLILAGIRSDPG